VPEPITTGALVAGALSAGAAALGKGVLGEAAKDAYLAVKNAVLRWAGREVEMLEAKPGAPAREAVVAELIDGQPADAQAWLADLAGTLVAALRAEAKERGPIGVEIKHLEAMEVRLREIVARAGTGFKADEVKTLGTFAIDRIETGGGGPGKA
jgi:hypothetical protein